jgi:DNA (cytosine-5)-methyltransferase 1
MIIAVDLFGGAGGMSLGALMAGITVTTAIESDSRAAATYRTNHPRVAVLNERIERVDNLMTGTRQPAIVFGGPPCQGFSVSNQKTRNITNEGNWLFAQYLRIVAEMTPAWVVFENVTGILQTAQGFFIREVQSRLNGLGYTTSTWVLNAADFGVPQRRSRLFVVGSLQGYSVPAPRPCAQAYVTVRDAIGDLPRLRNGSMFDQLPYPRPAQSAYAAAMRGLLTRCGNHYVTNNSDVVLRRFPYVPQGGNWRNIPRRLMRTYADPTRCHTGIYRRLRLDQPAVVIGNFRKNMLIHPTQDRQLSVREAARLQSFPDWYDFQGSIGFQQQQVGNAVPPLLAKSVFESVLRAMRQRGGA